MNQIRITPYSTKKLPAHLNMETYSPNINEENKGIITKDNAKSGYTKLGLNFDKMINQSMKPPANSGEAIRIQGLLIIDKIT